jgi:hypothetical protein
MSLDIDLKPTDRYERVSGYITIIRGLPDPSYVPSEWIEKFDKIRDVTLQHFVKLTDIEWKRIRKIMMEYIKNADTPQWRAKRKNWIIALDTLRAFER